jgi:tRNA (adenine37-N6)-methyltransferase
MGEDNLNVGKQNPKLLTIGVIHTPFRQSKGTPVQGSIGEGTKGEVEVYAEFAEGLGDIAGFERLWLIYLLDRVIESKLIVRPYLDTTEHGVFATRAPARPNPIGITVVRLLDVKENRLRITGVDMLDGTPLLDIKPYVPEFDSFENSRAGWYEGKSAHGVEADNRFEGKSSSK